MITWEELTAGEPKLLALEQAVLAEAKRAYEDPTWSFSKYWSWTLRPAIKPLAGWERDPGTAPELRTEEAWHAAMSHLIGLLPEGEGALAS